MNSMSEQKKFPTRGRMLAFFAEGSKKWFVLAAVSAVAMQAVSLINPKIISFTVDALIDDTAVKMSGITSALVNWAGGLSYLRGHLWLVGLAVCFVAIVNALISYLFRAANAHGAESLVRHMRNALYEHLLNLPFSWYSENHTGDIIQRCTSDVETVKVFLSEQLTSLLRIIVMITLSLFFMASIHPKLMLVSAIFIPVIIGYSYYFHARIGGAFLNADQEEGKLSDIAQENLTGVRVVRAFGRESYEQQRFHTQNEKYTNMWVRMMKLLTQFWMTGDLISGLQVLAVMGFGCYFTVSGQMSAGNYIAFVSYNAMLSNPVRMLGRVIANMSKAGVSIDRLAQIMNAPEEEDGPEDTDADMSGDIVFDHVSFAYENAGAEVLNDVSLTIRKGTTVGILGGTGSGKSTLVCLLNRLYDVPQGCGKITVSGQDIRHIRRHSLRRQIGMVLQEPYLFSRSLSDNIRIARPASSMQDVMMAAREASLDEAVQHFDRGYDTYVGERGVTLSGGQKQRTAIAQMLIRKPPLMIFDDSLSAVDAETDAKIRAALSRNTKGSTVILVAHRITTLMQADDIIVMDHGRIAEEGSHQELIAKDGIYKKIYDLQMQQE